MEGPAEPEKPEGKEAAGSPSEKEAQPPPRSPWKSWVSLGGGIILMLLGAAACAVLFRPAWILNPVLDVIAKDERKVELGDARWISPREMELSDLRIGPTNRIGKARIEFDYREFLGLEPAHEKSDREAIRLTDIALDRLGEIGSADLHLDLGRVVEAARGRPGVPGPIPSQIVLSNLTLPAVGRVGAVQMNFDFWDAVSSARDPIKRLVEPPRYAEAAITGIPMSPTGQVNIGRIDFDLGRAIAIAMAPTNAPMSSLTNLFDLTMSGISIGPTGKVDTVRARINLAPAIAAARNQTNTITRTMTGLTELAISGVDLGSAARMDSIRLRLDLSSAIAAAIRPDAPPFPGQTNKMNLIDVNIKGLSVGPSGRVETAHARIDARTALAAARDPSGVAAHGLTGLTEFGFSGIAFGTTGRIESVSLNLELASLVAAAIRPGAMTPVPGRTNLNELIISNVTLGDMGRIRSLRLRFDALAALRAFQRAAKTGGQPELMIEEILVDRPQLSIARQDIQAMQESSKARGPRAPQGPLVEIDHVKIVEGLLQVKGLGPTLPPLPIPLDQVVSNVVFGATRDHPSASKTLTIHVHNWTLRSPYDPIATVLRLESIAISFSIRGLMENRFDRIEFLEPTIFVGQDLFWLSDLMRKDAATRPKEPENVKAWSVSDFNVRGGRVVIATQGKPELELPFVFTASQKDLKFVSLRDLHLNAAIEVVPISLDYRERYGITVNNLRGRLEFALPRGNRDANNVVNTLNADRIAWKDVSASNSWVSVTFDVNGIYGRFGGESYGGYVNGDGTLLFKDVRDWVASVAGTELNLGAAATDLVPQHLRFTGRGSGKIIVQGRERTVLESSGEFDLLDKGRLEILALDNLMERMPDDWGVTKKDLAKIVLQAFRNYNYTSGDTDFLYRPPQSYLRAHFRGEEGKRDFDVTYDHDPQQDKTN